ncbi:unnamed protein product [Ectocarpus sp. 12 AP-2014]
MAALRSPGRITHTPVLTLHHTHVMNLNNFCWCRITPQNVFQAAIISDSTMVGYWAPFLSVSYQRTVQWTSVQILFKFLLLGSKLPSRLSLTTHNWVFNVQRGSKQTHNSAKNLPWDRCPTTSTFC